MLVHQVLKRGQWKGLFSVLPLGRLPVVKTAGDLCAISFEMLTQLWINFLLFLCTPPLLFFPSEQGTHFMSV